MAALIKQANKRVRNGQYARDLKKKKKEKKKERTHGRKEEKKQQQQHFLKRKRQEMSASNETKAGYTYSVHTIQLSIQPTTTRQGNRRSRTTPHKERMSGSLNIESTPPPSLVHRKERYNSRNKRASEEEKKTVNGKNRQLAQPQTLTQGDREIASLLN